ncbi:MAG: ion transporter [Firmicutes bacterium]|nr:ion transporter [Bacillota bacterium]
MDKKTKKRIFDIIQIGRKNDLPSRLFDFLIVIAILLNCGVLFLETFDELAGYSTVFGIIESLTILFFCVEYGLRIWTAEFLYPHCSKKQAVKKFLLSFDGVIDLMTILPFFYLTGFVAFRMLRVIRIFHLFRINAAYDSFNVITKVLYEKKNQIISSVFIIIILMLGSSLSMYSVEHPVQPDVFKNAFSGLWWSISTIFTVGYGDIYPVTAAGRMLGIFTTFLGVGAVAIPTGIISAGFVEQYTEMSKHAVPYEYSGKTAVITVQQDSYYCGKTVAQLRLENYIEVLVVIRGGNALIANPSLELEDEDIMVYKELLDDTEKDNKKTRKNENTGNRKKR